ncbi:MAG: hypothetical protein WCP79_15580 [Bacillota bacterium]
MALLDYEHWNRETDAYLSNWMNIFGSATISASDNSGPFNYGRYVQCYRYGRTLATASKIVWVQFHFMVVTPYNTPTERILGLQNNSGDDHVSIQLEQNRWIYLNYQTGQVNSGGPVCTENSWNFFQLRVDIDNSAGSIQCYVNGNSVASVSGVDTEHPGGPNVHRWLLTSNNNIRYANFVMYNESGNSPNARSPETRIFAVMPTSNGFVNDFTASGGANWECIDEQPNDGDNTYVSAASAPLSELYVCPNSGAVAGSTVYAVGVELDARKDDAGTNELDELIRSGGTTFSAGNPSVLTSGYQRFRAFWDTDPATAAAWTVANANAAQIGFRRTS